MASLQSLGLFDIIRLRLLTRLLSAYIAFHLQQQISDAGVAAICSGLQSLRLLDLSGCLRLTAASAESASLLPRLCVLRLGSCPAGCDAGLEALAKKRGKQQA